MTINKRLVTSGLTIAAAGAMLVGATFAFFSANDTSTGNVLGTGTLTINITDQNQTTDFQNEDLGANWQPGETRTVDFDVLNTGSLPVNLRGFATGTWGVGNEDLDSQNKVKVTQVERWNGSSWEILMTNGSGITGYFYYSPTGLDASLFTVNSGGRAQLRLSVLLDETAGNDFQGETFTAGLQVEAKQTNTTIWP